MITKYLSKINKEREKYKKKWKKFSKKQKIQYIVGGVLALAVVLSLSFYFFQGRPAEADWFNDGWHYRRQLTFDNASSTEHLANFPVLVKLNSSRVDYTNTQDLGEDIRFTDPDGVLLKYEIEKWDENGTSTVWVKIPQIDAQSTIDHIYMYYGNPDATDAQDAENVWDSNYKMVQHLQEASTSSDAYVDSTSNDNDGTATSTYTAANLDATGKIDGANEFDGSGDYIDASDGMTSFSALTFGGWVKFDVQNATQYMIYAGASSEYKYALQLYSNGYIYVYIDGSGNYEKYNQVTDSDWHYCMAVYDGSSQGLKFYFDGSEVSSIASGGTIPSSATTTGDTFIGVHATNVNHIDGIIDEVRISNTARSAEWIEAQYKSMTDDYVSFGAEELRTPGGNWTESGKYGRALDFDGTNDYVQVSDSTSTSITGDLTISAWVRPDNVDKEQTILGKWDETTANNDRSYRLWLDSSNKLNLSVSTDGSATTTHTGDTALSASTWYHVEATYDTSTSMDVYLNGKLDATQKTASVPASIDDNASNLYMGAKENTSGNIDTKFDGHARHASQLAGEAGGEP